MRKTVFLALLLLFSFVFLVALLFVCIINPLMHYAIEEKMQLTPESQLFQEWLSPTVPIYLQFYFLNLTNPDEFRVGAKPVLQQRGPYTYSEHRSKTILGINNTASTITYNERKQYHFVRNMSVGPESEIIFSVNLVYLTIASQVNWLPSWLTRLLEWAEKRFGDQLISRRNVSDWLWGYEDPFLKFIGNVITVNVSTVGLYAGKNDTIDGPYTIDSGVLNRQNIGRILSYHGHSSMSCWTTSSANQINGTDGSLFHSFVGSNESFYVFSPDICRSLEFTPRDWSVVHGIRVMRYLPLEDSFDSPKLNPKNRGFCPHWPDCFGTGVLDMSTCQPGAPIAVSLPHFVHADKTYQEGVIGLHPSAEFNTTFFIEPRTGVILRASKKLQINANIIQNAKFHGLANVSSVLLPVMFVNESVTVDESTANLLRHSIDVIPLITKVVASVSLIVAFAVIMITIFVYVRRQRSPDSPEPVSSERTPLLT